MDKQKKKGQTENLWKSAEGCMDATGCVGKSWEKLSCRQAAIFCK